MDNPIRPTNQLPSAKAAYQKFKKKLGDLRKKQNLVLKNFSKKAEAQKIDSLRKHL